MTRQQSRDEELLGQRPSGAARRAVETWVKLNLGRDFLERIANVPTERNEFGVDPFGFDPAYLIWSLPPVSFLYRRYFRVEAHGLDNVPEGPVLLVANHSGQIPIDGMMIATSMLLDGDPPRMVRSMIERWVPTLPFVSSYMARCGQVLGTPENCRRLLANGETILAFPEGQPGVNKTFDKRYQLQDFGYGFMRLALESGAPIVPVAVIGAEEQAPSFHNARGLARLIGAPAFPITPTFPLLPLIGLLPYPVKYRIWFGQPMVFEGDPDEEDSIVGAQVADVRTALADLIDHGLQERKHVFW